MAQVDEVGQTGPAVSDHGVRDLHHRQERDGAFLHPRPTGGRSCQQRQPFEGGAFDGVDEALGGGHADRSGEEAGTLSAMTATRLPSMVPSPVMIASSTPDFSAAAASSAAYSSETPPAGLIGVVSQERKDPSSRTMSTSSCAFNRGIRAPLSFRRRATPRSTRRLRPTAAEHRGRCGSSRPRWNPRRRRSAAAVRADRCRRAPGDRRRP